MLECVPNFSEGRDRAVVEELVAAIAAVDGVAVLKHESDRDHHRAVITYAGEAAAVEVAAVRAARVAVSRIDLRRHRGVHRRMGALDVCPFVPLGETAMTAAVAAAHRVGERIAAELDVPVYFYAAAAVRAERRALGAVRNLGFEKLRELVGSDAELAPDRGPHCLHPTAGATAVGARSFLIAFNVDLATEDVTIAAEIAREVRERDGGLPGVQALGFHLEEAGCAQVSTNLLDYRRTSLVALFDAIAAGAARRGVGVKRGELIGLAPAAALDQQVAEHVRLPAFDAETMLVERVVRRELG